MPADAPRSPMYPLSHWHAGVAALVACLEGWFIAMENEEAHLRLPDEHYQRSRGRPSWTEAELETLVLDLDAEHDQEVPRAPGTSTGSKAGPGFHRLALPQRLALAQQLDAIVSGYEGPWPGDHCPNCGGIITQNHACPLPPAPPPGD